MSRISLTVLTSIALTFALIACSSSSTVYEDEMKKDEYLKSNFPAKKEGKNANAPLKTTFDK
jgi:outer membrane protein assembly factor BamE (lipoprotein component of BamABCDE complex)